MTGTTNAKTISRLLIDADNASPEHLDEVLLVLGELGTINVRRAYGNWAKSSLKGWGNLTGIHSIVPMQQFDVAKGKSATDMRMTIDAMDLLYRGHVDGFGIMSSDSDFLPLAQRIREEGLPVYGFGTTKTPLGFRQACTRFFDVAALHLPDDMSGTEEPTGCRAAGRRRADRLARTGLQGVQAGRRGICLAVRARTARHCSLELRRPQLRLHAPFRPHSISAELRREGGARRKPAGQAPSLTATSCCEADTVSAEEKIPGRS